MYSREELLQWLRDLGDGRDDPPSRLKVQNHPRAPSPVTYWNRFASWKQALREAGFSEEAVRQQSRGRGTTYSKRELLTWLRNLTDDGTPPTQRELQQHPEAPAPGTYRNRFGSWGKALREAGVGEEEISHRAGVGDNQTVYSDEELCQYLQSLAAELGRSPRQVEVQERSDIGASTFSRRFGSFNDALRAAGLNVTKPHDEDPRYSREELLEYIRELTAEQLKPPSAADMNDAEGVPNANTYQLRFGSWSRAKRLAIRGDRDADADSDGGGDDLAAAEPRDPTTVPLGDDLAAAREDRGLSQAGLADAVGVSPSTVAHWETGDVTPARENAGRLHKALRRLEESDARRHRHR